MGSAICNSDSFGRVVGLPNKMRKFSLYSFRVLAPRVRESKITSEFTAAVFTLKMHFSYLDCCFVNLISATIIRLVFLSHLLLTDVQHMAKSTCCKKVSNKLISYIPN